MRAKRKRNSSLRLPSNRTRGSTDVRKVFYGSALALAVVLAFLSSACKKPEAPSAIVEKVKGAGAGDVESATTESIEQWFTQHRDVAAQVKPLCDAAKRRAAADWSDSTEGRVCVAAAQATFFAPAIVEPDKKKF
jgi:hypothetical protein